MEYVIAALLAACVVAMFVGKPIRIEFKKTIVVEQQQTPTVSDEVITDHKKSNQDIPSVDDIINSLNEIIVGDEGGVHK